MSTAIAPRKRTHLVSRPRKDKGVVKSKKQVHPSSLPYAEYESVVRQEIYRTGAVFNAHRQAYADGTWGDWSAAEIIHSPYPAIAPRVIRGKKLRKRSRGRSDLAARQAGIAYRDADGTPLFWTIPQGEQVPELMERKDPSGDIHISRQIVDADYTASRLADNAETGEFYNVEAAYGKDGLLAVVCVEHNPAFDHGKNVLIANLPTYHGSAGSPALPLGPAAVGPSIVLPEYRPLATASEYLAARQAHGL